MIWLPKLLGMTNHVNVPIIYCPLGALDIAWERQPAGPTGLHKQADLCRCRIRETIPEGGEHSGTGEMLARNPEHFNCVHYSSLKICPIEYELQYRVRVLRTIPTHRLGWCSTDCSKSVLWGGGDARVFGSDLRTCW